MGVFILPTVFALYIFIYSIYFTHSYKSLAMIPHICRRDKKIYLCRVVQQVHCTSQALQFQKSEKISVVSVLCISRMCFLTLNFSVLRLHIWATPLHIKCTKFICTKWEKHLTKSATTIDGGKRVNFP